MSGLTTLAAVKQAIMAAKTYIATQISDLAATVEGLFTDIDQDLTAHTGNNTIHVTGEERTTWNGKQSQITANGILKGDGAGGVTAAVQGTDFPAPTAVYTSTLTASGWVDGVQTVTITGLAADADGTVGYADGLTDEQITAMLAASIIKTGQAANSITFRAMGTVPAVDIPVVVVVVG